MKWVAYELRIAEQHGVVVAKMAVVCSKLGMEPLHHGWCSLQPDIGHSHGRGVGSDMDVLVAMGFACNHH